MIEGLKPYAEYKESGLPWLGSVPTHWDVRRTKLLLREVDSRSSTGKEQLLRVSQYTGVTQRKASNGSDAPDTRAASLVGYKRVSANDLVINIMLAWNGSLGASRYDGIASPAYCVYRFRQGALPWYYHELFRLPLYKGRIKTASTGVVESRLRLYSDDLGRIEALLPPLDEQSAIVRFLDHANRKIDGFIRAKRKLIGLLNEQKQAIIHRAVTRGLDPDVPLKDSGIPWLGEIPAHWEMQRLKHLASFQSGDGITSLQIEPQGDYPVYGGNGLRGYSNRYTHDGHFALIGRQGALCGNINYAKGRFFASEHAVVTTLRPGYSVVWFGEMLKVMNLNQYSQSAAQPGLAVERIKNLAAPVPPATEQPKLVAAFQEQTAPLNTAIARTNREIALMQEYRTRLTADIVTGKLDVRGASRHLPDEPIEAEPVTDTEDSEDAGTDF